jgi:8-oxo-dGTP pyrophosphatase MutT (NUDIX family)
MAKRRFLGKVDEVRQQFAALPFRRTDEGVEIMLITSRETRRWIIPKGWPMKGRSPYGTAAREALQEAGIRGHIEKVPIGSYLYIKRGLGGQRWPCTVHVFPLAVRAERDSWREQNERTREWFSFIEAAEAVEEPDLKSLILAFGLSFK